MGLQHLHQMVGHPVVDDPFAHNGALFQAIEGGGVVFIVHNIQVGIVGSKHLFRFSFVQLFPFFHCTILRFYKILFGQFRLDLLVLLQNRPLHLLLIGSQLVRHLLVGNADDLGGQ